MDDQGMQSYGGANFAPLRPFLALRENNGAASPYAKHYLAEALKAKYEDLIKKDERSWKEMISVGQLIALFIEGKQILDWNPYTQAYSPKKLHKTDPQKIKAVNFMQFYCSEWQDKWGSSNPDIVLNPMSNKDQDIARARKANAVVDHLEYKMYDPWYEYHEGLMAQVFGWYGNKVGLCNKNGYKAMKPIMADREVPFGRGFGKCHDCAKSGPGDEFNFGESEGVSMPICPACGSTAVYHEPPITQIMSQVVGQEEVMLPNVIATQLAFPACRWDMKVRMEDSSWAIIERDISLGAIRQMLGNIRLPEGESPNDFGLDVIRTLARTGAALAGRSDTGINTDKYAGGTETEMYLSAEDCYDIEIKGDEQTVDGQVLPKGKRLSEIGDGNWCVRSINGMSLITHLYPERHSETVTSGVYHLKALSGTGRGVADAVEIQKQFNRRHSQIDRFFATRATPATLYVEGAISATDRKRLGQPDVDIPVKIQNFPEIRDVRQLIAPLQGESVPGDLINYTFMHLQNFMQLAYHTTNMGGTTPEGVKNNTATYAEINNANADSIFSPTLSIKADVRRQTARKAFNLWCDNTPQKRFLSFRSPSRSGARGIEVSGEDVKGEYEWVVAPGSEQPKNKLSKRKDALGFYSLFGDFAGYIAAKQAAPQEVSEAERTWDMDFASSDYDTFGEVCRNRYEQGKEIMGQFDQLRQQAEAQYGMAPPMDYLRVLMSVKPTMLVTEPAHPEKAKWFSNLLDTDEGQESSDEERNLINAFILGHMQLGAGQAIGVGQTEAAVAVASNAPVQAQQDAQMAAQSQEAQGQEVAKGEAQAQQSSQQSQVAHEQEIEKTRIKHEQELEKAALASHLKQEENKSLAKVSKTK